MAKQDLNTIKGWFKQGFKPNQQQFWDLFDSFFHKDNEIAIGNVTNLSNRLNEKADVQLVQAHINDDSAHNLINRLAIKANNEDLQEETDKRILADQGLQNQINELAGQGFSINEDTPIANTDNEAETLGLRSYEVYITTTGEVRYKLPTGEPSNPPLNGIVDDNNKTFTFTSPEI